MHLLKMLVRVFSCYFSVSVCISCSLWAIFLSLCIDARVFVSVNGSVRVFVWVFHPWRDEKPGTICYAAVGQ